MSDLAQPAELPQLVDPSLEHRVLCLVKNTRHAGVCSLSPLSSLLPLSSEPADIDVAEILSQFEDVFSGE